MTINIGVDLHKTQFTVLARKGSKIVWFMLGTVKDFDPSLMIHKKLQEKSDVMRTSQLNLHNRHRRYV